MEIADKTEATTENTKQPESLPPGDVTQDEKLDVPTIHTSDDMNNSQTAQENLMIPVFSEWTQQQIQEAEKKLVELTNATETNKDVKNETLAKHQIVKMRQKNYASPDCGAKVLASNPEAQSTSSVLTDKDEYLLSPCTDRIWFVVELCDSIQSQRVELANFELFSSPIKTVAISVSNRFPTRDWTFAGQFEAKSERDVQVFDLSSTLFGKFVRVDLTYANTEHYCPLSFFRVFGTSEIEAFEVENEPSNEMNRIEDEVEVEHPAKVPNKENLLNRAGAAVMSIVHKAAEVLAKGNGNGVKLNATGAKNFQRGCMSLSHNIQCLQCSNDERLELDNFISCKNVALTSLLDGVRHHLVNSDHCSNILGFDLKSEEVGSKGSFISSILPRKYIAAMCNMLATDQKALARIEDISGIHSSLISKKDEVSLKNVSRPPPQTEEDPLCKQDFYATSTEAPGLVLTSNDTTTEHLETEVVTEQTNVSLSGDELNIFNVVESEQPNQPETSSSTDSEPAAPPEEPRVEEAKDENKLQEITRTEEKQESVVEMPQTVPPESSEVKVVQQEVKANVPEFKTEQVEVKINGDLRSANPPESVFLRLSNRIKTLEKNMTLSTQYLEELSRRYKKQIEDVQQSFAKLQASLEDQSSKKRESDKRDVDDKKTLRDNVLSLNQKAEYMEVILVILSTFFAFQTILVIALFKRISILRKSFAAHQQGLEVPPASPSLNNEKSRSTGRKRSKQRMRKISAPNILTQRPPTKNEFSQASPVLSRTVSAPNKFNASIPLHDNKENYDDMQAMLEENDDILIPGFDELKLSDDHSIKSHDLDTASTASAVSSNEKHEKTSSNRSFKFKRRLSSPFQLNSKSPLKKSNSERTNKKAMSESPSRNITEDSSEIQKSKSFQEDDDGSVKFKKSNSFKKLFKKIF